MFLSYINYILVHTQFYMGSTIPYFLAGVLARVLPLQYKGQRTGSKRGLENGGENVE